MKVDMFSQLTCIGRAHFIDMCGGDKEIVISVIALAGHMNMILES